MIQTKPRTETEALLRDLNKPSLHALSYALRHPDTWPKDFVWDFRDCDQCAMGLAHRLWKSLPEPTSQWREGSSMMARQFAMPYSEAERIFFGDAYTRQQFFGLISTTIPQRDVTPDMVADAIDKYLATAE
jgi:hypothetical protein